MQNTMAPHPSLKILRSELATLVGDEVFGRPETLNGVLGEPGQLGCARLCAKDASGKREARENIEDHSEVEAEEAEKVWNLCNIGHPDVVWVPGSNRSGRREYIQVLEGRRGFFFEDASDGAFREFPTGSSKSLGEVS